MGEAMLRCGNPPDVSVVITFHREGLLAHKSLLSLSRCVGFAQQAGYVVEVIATLDRVDAETDRVVSGYECRGGSGTLLLRLDVGDLGSSRNAAIEQAQGRHVLICDGDDYLSRNFIVRCVEEAANCPGGIFHPELVVQFGVANASWWQVGSGDSRFDPACMLATNPWNSCAFAARSTFQQIPYVVARPAESGFGYEDWHWNCETLAAGYAHHMVPGVVHYVRKKETGSLNLAHVGSNALIPPTHLFGIK